jgi:UDP-N-acetylmuramyl pentapeptide phosphotransferase/UDP-N-acetylglucosamine-1-phosphate transferase
VDDRFGDRKIKGLLGHIRQLLNHGKVTTGLWKAFIGIMLAALFAYTVDRGWGDRLFHMLLIAMSMNAVNLFDLRPGRALKLFAAGSGLLFVFALGGRKLELWLSLLYPLSVAAVIILPSDLRARTMLGDCGANLLGFALGCGLVLLTGFPWQLAAAGALVVMHIAAERISFTAVIERNVWMNWLDRLGRTEK